MITVGIGVQFSGAEAVAAHAVSGGIMESLSGGNFGHGFFAAGMTAAFMPQAGHKDGLVRATKGALIGGAITKLTGGKFANGALSGAIQAAMAEARGSRKSAGSGGKSDRLVRTRITQEMQDGFNEIVADLYSRTFVSESEAAAKFRGVFVPYTERWGLEVGANITKFGAYSIADITLGTRFAVNVPFNSATISEVHTHPFDAGRGFSGHMYADRGNVSTSVRGDYSVTWDHYGVAKGLRSAYVFQAGGGAWRFDFESFMGDVGKGGYIDARSYTRELP